MPSIKTPEEHFDFVESLCRVSFYFTSKWLMPKFPAKTAGELLKAHTPILHHALNYPVGVWDKDPECLEILAEVNRNASLAPDAFEESMWNYLKPLAQRRAEEYYSTSIGIAAPAYWNCGSLKYDPPRKDLPKDWTAFHINNAVGPQSIFDVPDYLPYCFLLILKEAEVRFGSRILYTSTWLNEREDFLKYFPQEWRDNLEPKPLVPPVPDWHFGWWGQLVTGRGTINPKTETFVREHGYLKYTPLSSHCSFENMRKHLQEVFL